jgi:hypothetical protein
MKERGHF